MLVTQVLTIFSLLTLSDTYWEDQDSSTFQSHGLIDLSPLKKALANQSDLHEKWKLFLLQDLLEQRMNVISRTSMSKEEVSDHFSSQINTIRVRGFEKEEFTTSKMHWINRLLALDEPCSEIVSSLSILHALEFEDLLASIPILFEKQPSTSLFHRNEQELPLFCQVAAPAQRATSPEKTSHSSSVDVFYELPLSENEKKLINELIRKMSERSIWGLLFTKREMERLGKRVNHVHPMRFISFILADPKLKHYLKDVSTSSFKWDHFIDGLSKRLKEEASHDNLTLYIPGMAHQLKFDAIRLTAFIKDKDYEGMVKAVLNQR